MKLISKCDELTMVTQVFNVKVSLPRLSQACITKMMVNDRVPEVMVEECESVEDESEGESGEDELSSTDDDFSLKDVKSEQLKVVKDISDDDTSSVDTSSVDTSSVDSSGDDFQLVSPPEQLINGITKCPGCLLELLPRYRVCSTCLHFYKHARLIATKVNETPIRYNHESYHCSCNEPKHSRNATACYKCRFNRLHAISGNSSVEVNLLKRQLEPCSICSIEYSFTFRFDMYYCYSCTGFISKLSKLSFMTCGPLKLERLKLLNSSGFLDKYLEESYLFIYLRIL